MKHVLTAAPSFQFSLSIKNGSAFRVHQLRGACFMLKSPHQRYEVDR